MAITMRSIGRRLWDIRRAVRDGETEDGKIRRCANCSQRNPATAAYGLLKTAEQPAMIVHWTDLSGDVFYREVKRVDESDQ